MIVLRLLWAMLAWGAPPDQLAYAVDAATPDIPAPVLLAVAWHESRYRPDALNVAGVTRRIPRRQFPPYWAPPYRCGVLQATVKSEARCRALAADVPEQYRRAAAELRMWRGWCRRVGYRPTLECALGHYASGNVRTRYGRAFARLMIRMGT